MAITASEARKNLCSLIEKVNKDRTPVEIISKRGSAVLVSKEDWDSLEATARAGAIDTGIAAALEAGAQAGRRVDAKRAWQQASTADREETRDLVADLLDPHRPS